MPSGYLLDTNVISETRRPRPHSGVLSFLSKASPQTLFMSVLTLGELQKGVEAKRLNDPAGAQDIQAWLDGIEVMFSDRIVPIDLSASRLWGILSALRSRPTVDTLLAATALTRDLIFVTRNARDIQDSGVTVLNPWHV